VVSPNLQTRSICPESAKTLMACGRVGQGGPLGRLFLVEGAGAEVVGGGAVVAEPVALYWLDQPESSPIS
jgi:hypothetical protein